MSCETKFRAVMDGGYVCYFTLKDILDPHPSFAPEMKILKRWIREGHDPDKFTGLHDKNGTEIYEGDILLIKVYNRGIREKGPYQFIKGLVKFSSSRGVFYLLSKSEYGLNKVGTYYDPLYRFVDYKADIPGHTYHVIEKIGNCFENPKLLETDCVKCKRHNACDMEKILNHSYVKNCQKFEVGD